MVPMSDKELDNLFKSKFEDAEFAPSDALWGKIEKQLEKPKKRTYPIFWMAAASVTLTVGSFFMLEKTDKMQLHAETQNVQRIKEVVSNVEEPVKYNSSPLEPSTEMAEEAIKANKAVLAKQSAVASRTAGISNANSTRVATPVNAESTRQIAKNENFSNSVQPIENTRRLDNTNPEVINNYASVSQVGLADEQPNAIKTEFALAAHDTDEDRKVIKNVGDLVNFVVDKVDKREQKLLKFSPDEDDSMRLVGINIGLLKWNKKK